MRLGYVAGIVLLVLACTLISPTNADTSTRGTSPVRRDGKITKIPGTSSTNPFTRALGTPLAAIGNTLRAISDFISGSIKWLMKMLAGQGPQKSGNVSGKKPASINKTPPAAQKESAAQKAAVEQVNRIPSECLHGFPDLSSQMHAWGNRWRRVCLLQWVGGHGGVLVESMEWCG